MRERKIERERQERGGELKRVKIEWRKTKRAFVNGMEVGDFSEINNKT